MIVWVVERTDYETEGCPEYSSEIEEVVVGQDAESVRERAEKRAAELHAGAYALTEYSAYPVHQVKEV